MHEQLIEKIEIVLLVDFIKMKVKTMVFVMVSGTVRVGPPCFVVFKKCFRSRFLWRSLDICMCVRACVGECGKNLWTCSSTVRCYRDISHSAHGSTVSTCLFEFGGGAWVKPDIFYVKICTQAESNYNRRNSKGLFGCGYRPR